MKIVITRSDGSVYVDGVAYSSLDLSSVPAEVHALQWDGEAGWIEFVSTGPYTKPGNEQIEQLPEWSQDALQKWQEAKSSEEAAAALAEQLVVQAELAQAAAASGSQPA